LRIDAEAVKVGRRSDLRFRTISQNLRSDPTPFSQVSPNFSCCEEIEKP
jgi:hypothetical protein